MSPRLVFLRFGRGQKFVECPLLSSLRVEIALLGEGLSYVTFLSSQRVWGSSRKLSYIICFRARIMRGWCLS